MASSDRALLQEQWDSYRYARDNGHLKYLAKAEKCENFFSGEKQWDDVIKRRLERQRRPAMTLNKILPNLAAVFGEQIENRADIAFRASSSGNPQTAAALDKVYLHVANSNFLDNVESRVFEDGAITSRGFYDVRMSFDNNIYGDIDIALGNPLNIMIDPDAEEYEPEKWREVTETKWLSLDDIKRIYGGEVHAQLKGRSVSSTQFGYDFLDHRYGTFGGTTSYRNSDDEKQLRRRLRVLERQYKKVVMREFFVDIRNGDKRPVPAHWDHNRKAAVLSQVDDVVVMKMRDDEVWWATTIEDVVAHHKRSIYESFTFVPYFPFFRRGTTIGLTENQIGPQEFYNKSMSQFLHVVNGTANSGWKTEKGAVTNMTPEELEERGAETGLHLELTDISKAEKIQPNQVPSGLDRLNFLIDNDLKDISMVSDSQRGFDRADVAAKAIMAKKAAGSSSFGTPLSNLQTTRRLVALKVLELVQNWMTEERMFTITTNGPVPETQEVAINQMTPEGDIINDVTQGTYSIVVQPVPARNDFEHTQLQEAIQLRSELGIPIPDEEIVGYSRLNNKKEIAEMLKARNNGEPNELEQQIAELEVQLKQNEVAKAQADQQKTQSETALNVVKAQEVSDQGQDPAELQAEVQLQQLQLERDRVALEARLEKYKIDKQLALQEREITAKLAIEREKLNAAREKQVADAKAQKDAPTQKAGDKDAP